MVGDDDKVEHDGRCKFGGSKIGSSEINSVEVANNKFGKKNQKTSKSKKLSKSKKIVGSSDFFILGAKLAFIKLR